MKKFTANLKSAFLILVMAFAASGLAPSPFFFFQGIPELLPVSFDFGDVSLGDSATTILSLDNVGFDDLEVNNISFQPGSSSAFTITSAPPVPFSLAAGESIDIQVTFVPTQAGYVTAIVSIDTNEGIVVSNLSGEGIDDDPPRDCQVDAGASQTVYLGYEPASCATLSAIITNEIAPVSYSWEDGLGNTVGNSASITVCPEQTTTYTVTAVDAAGCDDIDEVTVCVVDVRCHIKGRKHKVTVCHYPDDDGLPRTLCIAANAVPAHLDHGDHLGPCGSNVPCGSYNALTPPAVKAAAAAPELAIRPNPFSGHTQIDIALPETQTARLELYDAKGQLVETLFKGMVEKGAPQTIFFDGTGQPAGVYVVVLSTEKTSRSARLLIKR